MICEYNCGREAKYPPGKGRTKWCCSKIPQLCPTVRKKNRESHIGEKNHMFGKPCVFKGKTKDNYEPLKIVSEKIKEHHRKGNIKTYFLNYWKDKHHSDKTKLKISKKMRGNQYGKGRGYLTKYNGTNFRSSWEAEVAKYLDNKKIDWKYEEREFEISETESYRPDFFIYLNNTFIKLIEVKGFFREENKRKFEKFKIKYPHIKVELWDKTILKNKNII
jgi:hypothetical protein